MEISGSVNPTPCRPRQSKRVPSYRGSRRARWWRSRTTRSCRSGRPGDHAVPPAGGGVLVVRGARHVRVAGQGMLDEDHIVPVGRELAPPLGRRARHREEPHRSRVRSSRRGQSTSARPGGNPAGRALRTELTVKMPPPRTGVEVGEDVVDALDADGEPDQAGGDTDASCSSGVSCEWVVDAGWITSERTSPMLATWLCRVSALTNFLPASTPRPARTRRSRRCRAGRSSSPARATATTAARRTRPT